MVSTILLGSVALPAAALADEFDTKIQQSENKISELNGQEAAASVQLETVRANIEGIKAQAAELQAQQAKLNESITKLGTEIENLNVKIKKRDASIKEQARSVQVDSKANNYIDAILSADSISSAVTRVMNATKLVNASNDLMKQQEKDKNAVETKKVETESKVKELNETAAELEGQKGQLIDQEYQQQALVSEIAAARTTEEDKKAGFLQEKAAAEAARAEQARLAKLAEEQAAAAKLAEQQAAVQPTTNTEVQETPVTPVQETPSTEEGAGEGTAPVTPTPEPSLPTPTPTPEPSVPTPTPTPEPSVPAPTPTPVAPPASSGTGAAILAEAAKHIGKPYVWGAKGPDTFDCSGFTSYVYRVAAGREIGGWTVPQESAGTQISVSQAVAGDLLFWGSRGGTYHVAISTGGGNYIHAPAPGQNVTYGSSAYFAPDFAVRM